MAKRFTREELVAMGMDDQQIAAILATYARVFVDHVSQEMKLLRPLPPVVRFAVQQKFSTVLQKRRVSKMRELHGEVDPRLRLHIPDEVNRANHIRHEDAPVERAPIGEHIADRVVPMDSRGVGNHGQENHVCPFQHRAQKGVAPLHGTVNDDVVEEARAPIQEFNGFLRALKVYLVAQIGIIRCEAGVEQPLVFRVLHIIILRLYASDARQIASEGVFRACPQATDAQGKRGHTRVRVDDRRDAFLTQRPAERVREHGFSAGAHAPYGQYHSPMLPSSGCWTDGGV